MFLDQNLQIKNSQCSLPWSQDGYGNDSFHDKMISELCFTVLFLALNIPFSTSAIVDFRTGPSLSLLQAIEKPIFPQWFTPPVNASVPDQNGPAKVALILNRKPKEILAETLSIFAISSAQWLCWQLLEALAPVPHGTRGCQHLRRFNWVFHMPFKTKCSTKSRWPRHIVAKCMGMLIKKTFLAL